MSGAVEFAVESIMLLIEAAIILAFIATVLLVPMLAPGRP
jgi:hypothetical protein